LLNRIGECVRALPSFGRTRTQSPAIRAKRTLAAISTCSPERLDDDDPLRAVLARVAAIRYALDDTQICGAQRIAAEREAPTGPPSHTYTLRDGEVIRGADDLHAVDAAGAPALQSDDALIDDLARAGALIAAEIDRLQDLQGRRCA
jgi:hypothetical protein